MISYHFLHHLLRKFEKDQLKTHSHLAVNFHEDIGYLQFRNEMDSMVDGNRTS